MTIKDGVYKICEFLISDTGWVKLPLINGAVGYSEANYPQYRKIGNRVFLRGAVKGITSTNFDFAQLPEGCRPTTFAAYFVGGSSTVNGKATFYNFQVNPSGTMRINSNSIGEYDTDYYCRLSGSFLVD